MINANKELLSSFFSNNLQYVVPFFQRAYVWDEENWDILWEHINKVAEISASDSRSEHFIGTLITKQRVSKAINENKLDLIDGQQRLTTIALLLKSISTKASGNPPFKNLKEQTNQLVVFEDSKGQKFIRIELSRNDEEYFQAIILDKDTKELKNQDHKILRCYDHFCKKLNDITDEQLDHLKTVILNNVPLISMLLSAEDDEQEIFDTINSLGVRLTTGELLKNFIFSDNMLKNEYEDLWESVFEDDEDQISFWNRPKTSGRLIRMNIEVLLYCYLIIQRKTSVELEKLFNEYKKWLNPKTVANKIAFLKELKEYAKLYEGFPEGKQLNEISFAEHEKRFFHIIENLEITTVYPFVLYIYKQVGDKKERSKILRLIESYLVRRNVCKLTNKNYNNLFIQIIGKLEDLGSVTHKNLKLIIDSYTENTNKFPTNSEFSTAFENEFISNANAREILFCISLYQINNSKSDIGKLSLRSYSTEHMMPQKWETHWKLKKNSDTSKIERNSKIRTLGNLTLVTKSLNSSMKNAAWTRKRKELSKYSHLKITKDYIALPDWDEKSINNRAKDLAKTALKIWE